MDPITQAILGAIAPQSLIKTTQIKTLAKMGFIGALAGMSPDLDVLIRSSIDPLLFIDYHRHFTHSLAFIPIGALLCALSIQLLLGKRWQFTFKQTYLTCFLGYATHAILDANTTYGTQLLWPFSDLRVAWNTIAVIDLFYTLPLLIALIVGTWKRKVWLIRLSVIWIFLYPLMGMIQRDRAEKIAQQFTANLAIDIIYLGAKPTLGNITLWKIIYATKTHFYVDAVHIGLFQSLDEAKYYSGEKIKKLDLSEDFSWLDKNSQQAKDIERFRHFSNGFIAKDPHRKNSIIDIRYSVLPNEIKALWGIKLNPMAENNAHVNYVTTRDMSVEKRKAFFKMLLE